MDYQQTTLSPRRFRPDVPIDKTYEVGVEGLQISRRGSKRLLRWSSIRFVHIYVTGGAGTTGFPIYRACIRTRYRSMEIGSASWSGEKFEDQASAYVHFLEHLISTAIRCNPHIRLRHGGDPLLEKAIPIILMFFSGPIVLFLMYYTGISNALFSFVDSGLIAEILPWLLASFYAILLNALPWSSGSRFEATDLPVEELPTKYRHSDRSRT